MMPLDPYDVLGLSPSASEKEIRAAWRRLARQYHPDLNPAPDAHARLVQINHAYEVLSDPERRRMHDLGRAFRSQTFTPPPPSVYDPPRRPSEAEIYRPLRPGIYAVMLASWLLVAFMLLDFALVREEAPSKVLRIEGPSRSGYYSVQMEQGSFPLFWREREQIEVGDRLILQRGGLTGRVKAVYRCRLSSRAPCQMYEHLEGIQSLHFGRLVWAWGGAALCSLMIFLRRRKPEAQFRWALGTLFLLAIAVASILRVQ